MPRADASPPLSRRSKIGNPESEIPEAWQRGLTWRSILIGLALVVAGAVGAPNAIWGLASSEVTWSYMPTVVVFPFFVVVVANVGLKALRRRWALRPAELVVVFAMALVSAGTPLFLVGFLVALLASPYYGASPENRWAELIHPHLPSWAFPSDAGQAMRGFFEGLPRGEALPWAAWAAPLAWWLALVVAFYFVCLCLVVMLRRQWVERERLVYPLLALPQALIVGSDDERLVPRLLRNRLFWAGFFLPLGLIGWNVVSYFEPEFPQIAFHQASWVSFGQGFPGIELIVLFPIVGLAYFANSEVIFSVWFFYLLGVLQEGYYNRIGFSLGSSTVFCWAMEATGWQSFGAFVVMVLGALWMARGHLREVWAKAIGRGGLDDSNEILSYRVAVFGFLGGTVFLAGWLWRSGMSLGIALAFLALVYIIYLGLARIVSQTGVAYVTPPLIAQPFLYLGLGSAAMSHRDIVALSCAYGWHGDVQTTFVVGAAQGAKLADGLRVRGRSLVVALGLSALVGLVASVGFILSLGYERGAASFGSWTFRVSDGMGDRCFGMAVQQMSQRAGPDWGRLGCFGAGAAAMAVLMFLKYRFAGWPIHPVGLAVASVWTIRHSAFSIFLAWAAKAVLLRVGGVRLYQRAAPFFLGLILGCVTGIALSQAVDAIWFYGRGHFIYNG